MRLSLSTSWNAFRHNDGRSLIREIKTAGFDEIELSFNLTSSMVGEIKSLVQEGAVKVSSLHNYCPIPEGLGRDKALPDYWPISSIDQDKRLKGLTATKQTIDTALALGACAVVLHSGRVEVKDSTRELIKLYESGQKGTPAYLELQNTMIQRRREHASVYLESALESLSQLGKYAAARGILLGIENRYYYNEIPSFEEIGIILESLKQKNILYWHDTGHAQCMENLGLQVHQEYLKSYSRHLAGLHLHDINGCNDHSPIGSGTIDFASIAGYVPENAIRVLEVHEPAGPEKLRQSREILEKLFNP